MPKNTVSTSTSTIKTTDLKFPIKNDGTRDERYTMSQFVNKDGKKICVQHQRVKGSNMYIMLLLNCFLIFLINQYSWLYFFYIIFVFY